MTWHIELSRPAVAVLRSLPREEQRRVAERIRHLQEAGLPPGATGPVPVPAGEQVLICFGDPEGRRVVVVTMFAAGEATPVRMAGRWARRWIRQRTGGGGMGSFVQDIRFAARTLLKAPTFTAAAVVTLALGIGATTAVFSVVDGVLLEPLPYGDADGIVTVWSSPVGSPKGWVSEDEYLYFLQQNRTLDDLALYFTSAHSFTSPDNPERVGSGVMTPNLLSVLGVEPQLGRGFTWEEAWAEAPVVMLAHDVWQRRFLGDPGVVGRDVEINGRLYAVVGILPAGFVLPVDYAAPSPSEVFFPLPADVETPITVRENGGDHGYYAAGRLRDGVTVAEVATDLDGLIDRLVAQGVYRPENAYRPHVFGVKDDIVGTAKGTVLLLMAACGFVLLIACGNVANLLLARSDVRARDAAVRRALGAGRMRILRQLLSESLLLSVTGGALGLVVAYWGIDALLSIHPESVPRSAAVTLNRTVILFALVVSSLTAVVLGWVPAARVSGSRLTGALHDAGRGANQRRASHLQGLLVAGQMAMAVVLVAGASLMMRSFVALVRVDPGMRAENVLTMRLTAPSATYPDVEAVTGFYEELLRRVREIPGVRDAGAGRLLPLASQMGDSGFRVVGYVPAPGESATAEWQYATPGWLEVLGIPVLSGRPFDEGDRADAQTVMLVNETAARRFWPDGDALGGRVSTFGGDTAVVVGIVGDIRHNGRTEPVRPRYYRAQSQITGGAGNIRRMTLAIQTQERPGALVNAVRRVVRDLDPSMPVSEVRTMDDVIAASVAQPRFAMTLLLAFAGVALTLAVVGIYGVLAYVVSRRTREIGIRMALGAPGPRVVRMVVGHGMAMSLWGVALGTALAFALTGLMQGLLYGVAARDPVTFVVVPSLFATVALVACWIPAARAARVRPAAALRSE